MAKHRGTPSDSSALISGKQDGAPQRRKPRAADFTPAKRQRFLDALAMTCNVRHAAAHAGVDASTVYFHRNRDETFAEQWRAALAVGYDQLEALVLEHGGAGIALEPPDPARAEAQGMAPAFDFDKAIKALQQHRRAREGGRYVRSAARQRATREETNAALMKAIAAAGRRLARRQRDDE